MKDFISEYKKYHKLNDEWERDMRQKISNLDNNTNHINKSTQDNFHGDCDHPNTMETGTAIILYIMVMIGGTIFNDRVLIWVVVTFIFLKFITRHQK